MKTVSRIRQVFLWVSTSVVMLHVVLFQAHTVKCQSSQYEPDIFGEKMLPFCVELPGALRSGNIINITGFFGRQQYLRSNSALNVILRSHCLNPDTPLQLSFKSSNRTVTGNSFRNGNWEEDQTEGPFPFHLGGEFLLQIEVRPDGYMVKANTGPLWKFSHRFPFDDVKYLEVTGDRVFVSKIESADPDSGVKANTGPLWKFSHRLPFDDVKYLEVTGDRVLVSKIDSADPDSGDQQRSQLVYPVPLTNKPILHPTSPFWGQFPKEVKAGKAIRIKGVFPTKPDRASINLCANCFIGPVMLHFDIRFQFHQYYNRVLRCYYKHGNWLKQESEGPFPFSVGKPFDLVIQITPQSFNISVGNEHYWTYTHQVPFKEISSIRIVKKLKILKIEYIDFPEEETRFPLMLTEEPNINESSSAASVSNNMVFTIHALPLLLFLKAM